MFKTVKDLFTEVSLKPDTGIYNASIIALYIIYHENEHGRPVSNLRLQKLLYFIQANFLVTTDKPCFSDDIEAWDFGPVVPSIYKEYKLYGGNSIPVLQNEKILYCFDDLSNEAQSLINETLEQAANYATTSLVQITLHQLPWMKGVSRWDRIISNESIKKFFKE